MEETPAAENGTPTTVHALHDSLLQRAKTLLAELRAFESFVLFKNKQHELDVRSLKNSAITEMKALERFEGSVSEATTTLTDDAHYETKQAANLQVLYSSNLSFWEAVWSTAKRCHGIQDFRKRLHWKKQADEGLRPRREAPDEKTMRIQKYSVLVDIIADDGLEWIKVSTTSEKRLLHEMAKQGWNAYDDESEPEFDSDSNSKHDDEDACLELVKLAQDMMRATKAFRVRCRRPRVRFVLTRIREGVIAEVDAMIADMRATGATVECENVLHPCAEDLHDKVPQDEAQEQQRPGDSSLEGLSQTFNRMLPYTLPRPTSTLNIDCTILLCLISDITNLPQEQLPPAPNGGYHSAITRQIKSEATQSMLQSEIYPLLAGRDLVCTYEPARRMRDIVETMGTATERRRAEILFGHVEAGKTPLSDEEPVDPLFGWAKGDAPTSEQLLAAWRPLTMHYIPEFRLPVKLIMYDVDHVLTGSEPAQQLPVALARAVKTEMSLSETNKSVLFYGWDAGVVTVSSNRVVALAMEKAIGVVLDRAELEDTDGDDVLRDSLSCELEGHRSLGPEVWLCSTARSLVGKDRAHKEL